MHNLKMEFIKDYENKLLGRREIIAKLEVSKETLSRQDAKAQIVKALKVDENLIIVKNIKTQYGSKYVEIIANIYENEKLLRLNSRAHLIKRNMKVAENEATE